MTESDQETVEPPTEGDDDTELGRAVSPEEVAREFLRAGGGVPEGGGVAPRQPKKENRRRVRIPARVATVAGVAGVVAVLVLLAYLALLPNHPPAPARTNNVKQSHATDSPVTKSASVGATTTTTVPLPPPASVTVDVLNAYGSGQLAPETALRLISAGFAIKGTGNAPGLIAGDNPSEIFYGPSRRQAADTLAKWLIGPVKEISSANLTGNNLELWIANPFLGVETTTTTTTLSSASSPPPTP